MLSPLRELAQIICTAHDPSASPIECAAISTYNIDIGSAELGAPSHFEAGSHVYVGYLYGTQMQISYLHPGLNSLTDDVKGPLVFTRASSPYNFTFIGYRTRIDATFLPPPPPSGS